MEAHVHNHARVTEAAQCIANELLKVLARRYDSHMQQHLKKCPVYKNGLTNGEVLLATMRALSLVQLEVVAEMAGLTETVDADFLDAREPAKYAPDPKWKRTTEDEYQYNRADNFPASTRESGGGDSTAYHDAAFLEPYPVGHDMEGRPLYYAYLCRRYDGVTNYFQSEAPMSVADFQRSNVFDCVPHTQTDGAVPVPV